jgi:hypothetical protein
MPYSRADDITTGVECFMCVGKKYQGKSWHALYLHIIRKHPGIKPEHFVGSHLHRKAREETIRAGRIIILLRRKYLTGQLALAMMKLETRRNRCRIAFRRNLQEHLK